MKSRLLSGFIVYPTPIVEGFVELSLEDETLAFTRFVQVSRHLALLGIAWCAERRMSSTHAKVVVLFLTIHNYSESDWRSGRISVFPRGATLDECLVSGLEGGPRDGYVSVHVRDEWTALSAEKARDCLVATWVYVVDCAVGGLSGADAASLEDYLRRNFGAYRWVSQERQDRQSKVWARLVADIDEGGVARTRIEASLDRVEWEQLGEDFPARADLFALTQVMKTIRLVHGRLKFEPKFASSVWVKGTAVTPRPEAFHFEPFDVDLKAWAAERDSQGQRDR